MGRAPITTSLIPSLLSGFEDSLGGGYIAPGEVDERSIVDVRAADLQGYTQCHFFAGVGGWSYALRLAGWSDDRPVWTGSCPCQPFSTAGKRAAFKDARDLWPAWLPLVSECQPAIVFGEQVTSPAARSWLARTRADLESRGYRVGAADLCASSIGAHHVRQRFWWVGANAFGGGRQRIREFPSRPWSPEQFEGLVQATLQSAVPAGRLGSLSDGVSGRVGKLRAFGNAIVPQVAAEFIGAFLDIEGERVTA